MPMVTVNVSINDGGNHRTVAALSNELLNSTAVKYLPTPKGWFIAVDGWFRMVTNAY